MIICVWVILPILFGSEVVLHDKAGFAESRAKILLGNGFESVETSYEFSIFQIDISELDVHDEQCPTVSKLIFTKVQEKNSEYKNKFFEIIEGLENDLEVQNRVTRVVPAVVVPILTAVGSTIASESISLFFDIVKKKEHSKRLNAIESEIGVLQDALRGSICQFSGRSITNRLILIDKKYFDYLTRVKSEVERVVFDRRLNLETKLKACLAVNKFLSAETCLEVAKSRNFKFSVVSIEKKDEGFNIDIVIEMNRVVEVSSGNRIEPIGIPVFENGEKFLVYPHLPNFIGDNGEKWSYEGEITQAPIQIWSERLVNRNLEFQKDFDEDCLAQNNTTEVCDGYFEKVYSDFQLVMINRQQIISTFVKCSFKREGQPIEYLEKGIHHLNGIGLLSCGVRTLNLNTQKILPIQVRKESNGFGSLNRISHLDLSQIPIYDIDNPVNKIPVVGKIKFYTMMMMVLAISITIVGVACKLTATYFFGKYRQIRSLASTPY